MRRITALAFAAALLFATAGGAARAQQTGIGAAQSAASASALASSGGSIFNFGGSKTNTPDAVAPGLAASPGCTNSTSIGLGAMGFGISGGSTYPYQECNMQQWSNIIGKACQTTNREDCWWWLRSVICAGNPTVRAVAPPGVCAPAPQPVAAAAPPAAVLPYQTYSYYPAARAALPAGYTYQYQQPVPVAVSGTIYVREGSGSVSRVPSWCATASSPAERERYRDTCRFGG